MSATAAAIHPAHAVRGGRLLADDGRELPLTAIDLRADACAGLARVVVEQRFANPWTEPLTVTYSLPLPHDGAVSGFAFRLGERRVVGEVEGREAAREHFERALLEGRSAALLEQERGSLFTQQVGNVPPGGTVVAEVTVDQPLAWLAGGAWEWRFPFAVGPRYLGAAGRVADAERVFQEVAEGGVSPLLAVEARIRDRLVDGGEPVSPSHALRVQADDGGWRVRLDEAAGGVDRDLVLRWPVAGAKPGAVLDVARPEESRPHADCAYGLLTVVPPAPDRAPQPLARDLVLLLDTSGSMSGEPLARAKAVATRLVRGLGARDRLEMIEFGSRPRAWRPSPVAATGEALAAAERWLADLSAGGATEMVDGMLAALRPRRDGAQRQVVLVSDGYVGFEAEVVRAVRDSLPATARLHSVGVGPAANRSLTAPCARAGRGVEVLVGLEESAEAAAERLLARLAAPLVTGLSIAGSALVDAVPAALPDLYAGAPARIGLELDPRGGELRVRGHGVDGRFEQRLAVAPCAAGTGSGAVVALYGREAVEDLELALAAGGERARVDAAVERIGLDFRLATRLTSWVAVSEERDVDPQAAVRRVRQPQQLPRGLSAEGLGLADDVADACMMVSAAMLDCFPSDDEPQPLFSPATVSRRLADRDMEGDADEEGAARVPTDLPPPEPRSLPLFAPARLQVRLLHRDGERLVFELLVTERTLSWHHPDRVEITWDDGVREVVELLTEPTTAKGRVAKGASLRIALRCRGRGERDRPLTLHLRSGLFTSCSLPVER